VSSQAALHSLSAVFVGIFGRVIDERVIKANIWTTVIFEYKTNN